MTKYEYMDFFKGLKIGDEAIISDTYDSEVFYGVVKHINKGGAVLFNSEFSKSTLFNNGVARLKSNGVEYYVRPSNDALKDAALRSMYINGISGRHMSTLSTKALSSMYNIACKKSTGVERVYFVKESVANKALSPEDVEKYESYKEIPVFHYNKIVQKSICDEDIHYDAYCVDKGVDSIPMTIIKMKQSVQQ